ncbi:hypothetical protein NC651_010085 [Populus alba x Populus x berolinensis]|nr:hypothetical protein NC651_010085 [Populus alba x Populus x berolinensis]
MNQLDDLRVLCIPLHQLAYEGKDQKCNRFRISAMKVSYRETLPELPCKKLVHDQMLKGGKKRPSLATLFIAFLELGFPPV